MSLFFKLIRYAWACSLYSDLFLQHHHILSAFCTKKSLKIPIRICISKDRQYNGQKTKDKQHIVQSNIHKAKERVTRTPLKTGGELRCSVSQSILKNGLILSFKQFFGWCHLLVVKHCCAKWQKMVFAIKVWFKVDYCFPIIFRWPCVLSNIWMIV
jgi:hypothetical protein